MKAHYPDLLYSRITAFDSHRQELNELQEIHGAKNVTDFFYSEHRGSWILKFKEGEDQEFDTKQEMIQWIITEGDD